MGLPRENNRLGVKTDSQAFLRWSVRLYDEKERADRSQVRPGNISVYPGLIVHRTYDEIELTFRRVDSIWLKRDGSP